jgi:hypothetical protein
VQKFFVKASKKQFNRKDNLQGKESFMNTVLEQNQIARSVLSRTNGVFGEKIGIMGKIFGCWHKQLSRPFTNQKSSYRACLHCGALKRFDAETLKTVGPFYYPPTISLDK